MDNEDICNLVKKFRESTADDTIVFSPPDKAELQKILKNLGGDGRGLKTSVHYLKKISQIIETKCSCILPWWPRLNCSKPLENQFHFDFGFVLSLWSFSLLYDFEKSLKVVFYGKSGPLTAKFETSRLQQCGWMVHLVWVYGLLGFMKPLAQSTWIIVVK